MIQQAQIPQYNTQANQIMAQAAQGIGQLGDAWQGRQARLAAQEQAHQLQDFTNRLGQAESTSAALALQRENPTFFKKVGEDIFKNLSLGEQKRQKVVHSRSQYYLDTKQYDKYTDYMLEQRQIIANSDMPDEEKAMEMEDIDRDLEEVVSNPEDLTAFNRSQEDFIYTPEELKAFRGGQGLGVDNRIKKDLAPGGLKKQRLENEQLQLENKQTRFAIEDQENARKFNRDMLTKEMEVKKGTITNKATELKLRADELAASNSPEAKEVRKKQLAAEGVVAQNILTEAKKKKDNPFYVNPKDRSKTELDMINDASVLTADAHKDYTRATELLGEIGVLKDTPQGLALTLSDVASKWTGDSKAFKIYRKKVLGLMTKEMLDLLPKGSASDVDVAAAKASIAMENPNPKEIRDFLLTTMKIRKQVSEYQLAKGQVVSKNRGNLAEMSQDIPVTLANGEELVIGEGQSFDVAWQKRLDAGSMQAEAAKRDDIQKRLDSMKVVNE